MVGAAAKAAAAGALIGGRAVEEVVDSDWEGDFDTDEGEDGDAPAARFGKLPPPPSDKPGKLSVVRGGRPPLPELPDLGRV